MLTQHYSIFTEKLSENRERQIWDKHGHVFISAVCRNSKSSLLLCLSVILCIPS